MSQAEDSLLFQKMCYKVQKFAIYVAIMELAVWTINTKRKKNGLAVIIIFR